MKTTFKLTRPGVVGFVGRFGSSVRRSRLVAGPTSSSSSLAWLQSAQEVEAWLPVSSKQVEQSVLAVPGLNRGIVRSHRSYRLSHWNHLQSLKLNICRKLKIPRPELAAPTGWKDLSPRGTGRNEVVLILVSQPQPQLDNCSVGSKCDSYCSEYLYLITQALILMTATFPTSSGFRKILISRTRFSSWTTTSGQQCVQCHIFHPS